MESPLRGCWQRWAGLRLSCGEVWREVCWDVVQRACSRRAGSSYLQQHPIPSHIPHPSAHLPQRGKRAQAAPFLESVFGWWPDIHIALAMRRRLSIDVTDRPTVNLYLLMQA